MYAFVKASVLFLLAPLTLTLIFLSAGLCYLLIKPEKRIGSVLVGTGFAILMLFSLPFFPDALLGRIEQAYPSVDVHAASTREYYSAIPYVVVLAGGHAADRRVPVTSQFTYEGLVRLIEGIRLYGNCKKAKLILSGGSGEDEISDAQLMSELAVQLGVNKGDIVLEPDSNDTYQEAALLKGILRNDRFFLVTSAFHMPRAIAIFEMQGMKPVAAPTGHYVKQSGQTHSFVPDGKNLFKSYLLLYEALGYVKAKAFGRI